MRFLVASLTIILAMVIDSALLQPIALAKLHPTPQQPSLLEDASEIQATSQLSEMVNVNGILFFIVWDSAYGWELWKSDGAPEGTVLVKDLLPGEPGKLAGRLTDVNGRLFFAATDGVLERSLWKSDGTAEGTYW